MYKPVSILVIDDAETNLFMLSMLLKREGFIVLTATSGPEGRRLARERAPDLILLDVVMPEEDGFRTCALLKRDAATAAIPILFLSALEDTESKIKGLGIGAADFITKPFMKEEILVRIRAHVRLRRDQSAFLESLGTLLAAELGDSSEKSASFYGDVPIADGIHGILCARFEEPSNSQALPNALRLLLPRVATPLLSPDEAVVLMNYAVRNAYPGASPFSAAYCVYNRNASRLSTILCGNARALVAGTKSSASFCGKPGDALCSREVPFLQRTDCPAKPDARVCILFGAIDDEELLEVLRLRFLSGVALPPEAQRQDMAEALRAMIPSAADDRVLVFEVV